MNISPTGFCLVKNTLKSFVESGHLTRDEYNQILSPMSDRKVAKDQLELRTRSWVAEKCGISTRTLDRIVADGKLRTVKIAKRSLRFHLQDVLDYLEGGKNE